MSVRVRELELPAVAGPHARARLLAAGPAAAAGRMAVVLLHGRGGNAEDMLRLGAMLGLPDAALLAPQAAENTWYPTSFLAPRERNEPHLASALEVVDAVLRLAREGVEGGGGAAPVVGLVGFSQGACLALEATARRPGPPLASAVAALSGGLIGPTLEAARYAADLRGVGFLLGAADPDAHVPFARVRASAEVLEGLGGAVEVRRYEGQPHAVNADEVRATRALLLGAAGRGEAGRGAGG